MAANNQGFDWYGLKLTACFLGAFAVLVIAGVYGEGSDKQYSQNQIAIYGPR